MVIETKYNIGGENGFDNINEYAAKKVSGFQ